MGNAGGLGGGAFLLSAAPFVLGRWVASALEGANAVPLLRTGEGKGWVTTIVARRAILSAFVEALCGSTVLTYPGGAAVAGARVPILLAAVPEACAGLDGIPTSWPRRRRDSSAKHPRVETCRFVPGGCPAV